MEPTDDRECTHGQLTGLKKLLDSDVAPYVDFAVWRPHGLRVERKLKFQGLRFGKDGELVNVEIHGPPNVDVWMESFMLMRTGLISFEAVSLGRLEAYSDKINHYADRYGPEVWALLYQADVRCRSEYMGRTLSRLIRQHSVDTSAGRPSSFETIGFS